MNWENITDIDSLNKIIADAGISLIYKHSNRCGTSYLALDQLEQKWSEELADVPTYIVDVIENRAVARSTVDIFGVPHQSPQLFLVKNGEYIYENSHMGIDYNEIKSIILRETANQNA